MSEVDLEKRFPIGSVAYYIKANRSGMPGHKEVGWGVVSEVYKNEVCIELYGIGNFHTVNGVLENHLVTPTRWQKLPKGWCYKTQLVTVEMNPLLVERVKNINIKNPKEILGAIDEEILVKNSERDDCYFEADIDMHKGWRILRKYNSTRAWHRVSLRADKAYATYAEAQAEIDAYNAEIQRQCALSDYDWSVEQIDHELDMWAGMYHIPDDTKANVRRWILLLDKVEDVELRIYGGELQWKYWNKKRWMNFNTD